MLSRLSVYVRCQERFRGHWAFTRGASRRIGFGDKNPGAHGRCHSVFLLCSVFMYPKLDWH